MLWRHYIIPIYLTAIWRLFIGHYVERVPERFCSSGMVQVRHLRMGLDLMVDKDYMTQNLRVFLCRTPFGQEMISTLLLSQRFYYFSDQLKNDTQIMTFGHSIRNMNLPSTIKTKFMIPESMI